MTNQEIFDKVVSHLLTQNARSMRQIQPGKMTHEVCAYRGQDGTSCAIGCLIPDEIYTPNMEGWNLIHIMGEWPEVASLFEGSDTNFLQSLQSVHDSYLIGQWKQMLREVGHEYRLILPKELNDE
jgi:hypothetical protein